MPETADQAVLRARVDRVLEQFVEDELRELVAVDEALGPLAGALRTATARGKRLRAAFCYWGWRGAGQPDSDALVRAAASMELVHAAAVVHDDLIDESLVRHGGPTAHVALRTAFTGRPAAHARARSLAMLAGDLLMAWAGQLFTTCGLPAAYLSRARDLWTTLSRELVAGEALEILHTADRPDVARSLKVIRYKTAKYTVEHPLHIGAALAGAPVALKEAFTGYGLPLGEAFQLRDDLLGVFGDPEVTGKSNTDDLSGARPTALVAAAWETATTSERREMSAVLGGGEVDARRLERLRHILQRTGARARVENMVTERVRLATDALRTASLPHPAHRALTHLATASTTRQG
ncbi:polyprenyl synthetase family protein [Streptomyces sp. NPDC059740]|uniref:polyprenyl synthetase family protein n=1 Tax=Streptomyces sp. NPDC059740 TaxID=3346926 RepID=UPI003649CF19